MCNDNDYLPISLSKEHIKYVGLQYLSVISQLACVMNMITSPLAWVKNILSG